MATNTKNYGLQKDDYEDFYDVGVVNKNLDKIDEQLKIVETEAKNKDGGNADTVDGKHATELQDYNNLTNKPQKFIFTKSDNDDYYKTEINENGIAVGWNDEENDTNINFNRSGISASGTFKPNISGFEQVSADKIVGDGSGITNVNAKTLNGKSASDFATSSHSHSDYVSKTDTIAIANGGTGATTASGARANLELGNSATRNCTTAVTSGEY